MDYKRKPFAQTIVALLIALVVVSPLAVIPERAEATIPTTCLTCIFPDLGSLVQNIFSVVESVYQSFISGEDWYKEWVADPLAWFAQNGVIQSVVRGVVTDVVSGDDGNPLFITNLRDQLLQTGDAQVQEAVGQLRANWAIDLPFRDTFIDRAADAEFRFTGPGAFERSTEFTLGDFTEDVGGCWSGDIVSAGLNCILGMSGGFTNDPIGAQGIVAQRLRSERSVAEEALRWEAEIGNGFLAQANCEGDGGAEEEGSTGDETVALSEGQESRVNCTTQTPGFNVASIVNSALPANLERLMQADEISEVLGGLFAQFLTDIITGDGLLGSTRSSSGGRSYLDEATDPTNTPGGTDLMQRFLETLQTQITSLTEYIQNWQKIILAAESARAKLESCGVQGSTVTVQPKTISCGVLPTNAIERTQRVGVCGNSKVAQAQEVLEYISTVLLPQAQEAAETNNPNLLASLLQQYEDIQTLSAQEISEARNESQDLSAAPSQTGVTPSLVTEMKQITNATLCNFTGLFDGIL